MSNHPVFRESLLAARERLLTGREEIRAQHEAGSPGIQVSTHLTELLDTVLLDLYETALADYKLVNGWYLAYSVEVNAKGRSDKAKYVYEKIEANVPLDEKRFAMPQAAKPAGAKP